MKDQLQFIVSGSETKRYHTVRTLQEETVGHHSHQVAMFCALLSSGRPSTELLLAALTHDLAEYVLGDIPSPAKRQYGIGDQVNELEERLLTDVGLNVTLAESEKRILKLADIFQGMTTCLREIQMGNAAMVAIFQRYASYAEEKVLVGREKVMYNTIMEQYNERG